MAFITPDLLEAAGQELTAKSKQEIETETAAKWGARAAIAYALWKATADLTWYAAYVDYSHEACEHAASAGVAAEMDRELRAIVSELG